MKKLLIIIFLLFIIVVTSSFVFLKSEAQSNDSNYFNTNLRSSLSRYEMVRNILGLHYDGDARADYMGNRTNKILIEVLGMEGVPMHVEIIDKLVGKIEEITGKKTSVTYSFKKLPFSVISDNEELTKQLANLKINENSNGTAVLYVLIVNQDKKQSRIGSTLQENAIILYENNLKQLQLANDSKAFDQYAIGVLLHEFGHQIGLAHNNRQGCLMNPVVEISDKLSSSEIVSDFCEYEKKQINSSLNAFR